MKSRTATTYDIIVTSVQVKEYLFEFVAINKKLTTCMLPKLVSMAFLYSIWPLVQGYNAQPTELTSDPQIESHWR